MCLFLITKAPSTVERDRLDMHGVVLGLDETGQVVGIELTEDVFYDDILEDISTLNSIWYVRLKQVSCSDELFRVIAGLPNLRSVSCRGCTISDKQLAMLQNLQLQMIDLGDTTGPRDCLAALGQQASLIRMAFDRCRWFADDDLRLLPSFPMLADLDISKTSITDDGLATLEFCQKLGCVQLTGCSQLTGASLRRLQLCRGLKILTMQDVPVSLSAAVEFQAARPDVNLSYDQIIAPDLVRLIRQDSNVVKTSANFYEYPPQLHGLIRTLNVNLHSPSDVGVLNHLPELTTLRMTGPGVDDSALPSVANMTLLRTLDLSRSRVSESAFSEMPVLKELETIRLTDTQVSVATLSWLASLPQLRSLDLSGSTINGSAMDGPMAFLKLSLLNLNRAHFAKDLLARLDVPVLHSLELRSCELDDADLNWLAAYTKLQVLDLAENPLDGHGLASLQNLPLIDLRLDRTALTDVGLETVSCLKMLRELDVSGTTISGTGFRKCSELPIYTINLESVTLSSEGLDAICQLKSLRSLNFQNAVLPEDSWQSLGNKPRLHSVSLDGKSEVIQAFAQPENLARLKVLTLNRPDRNALRCIRQFTEVDFVRLLHCDVDEAAAELIVLAQNCTTVELHECTISAEAMRILTSCETIQNIQLRNVNTTQIDTESLQLINSKIRFIRK
ncbi:MAG: hypothetical protein WKF77_21280 [Planctomycetaceae bacterium]